MFIFRLIPELEAFGQTYVEALAAGIPSVLPAQEWQGNLSHHGKNALVVDFQNSEQVYQSILTLLNDADLRETLIRNGREDVKESFSLEKMISNLENFTLSKQSNISPVNGIKKLPDNKHSQ
ncbi:MAG: glycosyltransferase family 4 protein [Chitinophagaceae bacterium]|nr:glycosyltransferase family 4 protein [Chitinophagaceae bacterium]